MPVLFVEYHASLRRSASYMMDQEADMEVVSRVTLLTGSEQRIRA